MKRYPLLPLLTHEQLLLQSHGVRLLLPYMRVGRETLAAIFGKEEAILHQLRTLTLGLHDVDLLLKAEDGLVSLVGEPLAEDIIESWYAAFEQLKSRGRPTHQRYASTASLAMN